MPEPEEFPIADNKAMVVITNVVGGLVEFDELRTEWSDSAKLTLSWEYDFVTNVEDRIGDVYEVTFRRVARGLL